MAHFVFRPGSVASFLGGGRQGGVGGYDQGPVALTSSGLSAVMLLQPLPGLRDFELVPLSTTDRQILRATNHKLQNHATIPTACSNFHEVLLADFPAEVFLQYPEILQSLIRLLGWHGVGSRGRGGGNDNAGTDSGGGGEQGSGGPGFDMLAMECLEALLMAMQRRIRYLRDRQFFDRLPAEAAQPDAANATASQPTPVNLLFLCHAIFVQASTMLSELDKLETTLGLLKAAVPLLGHMSKPRAEVDSAVQSRQRDVVRECLGIVGGALHLHQPSLARHREVVNLLAVTVDLLNACVPADASHMLPACLRQLLPALTTNELLRTAQPAIVETLKAHLPVADLDELRRLDELRIPMMCAKRFKDLSQQGIETLQPESIAALEEICDGAIQGMGILHFTLDVGYVESAVRLCFSSWPGLAAATLAPVAGDKAEALLLKTMVFPVAELRRQAYTAIEAALQDRAPAGGPNPYQPQAAAMMQRLEVLYHLVLYGLDDGDGEVRAIAQKIFLAITTLDEHSCVVEGLSRKLQSLAPLLQTYFTDPRVGRQATLLTSNIMVDPRTPPAQTFVIGLRALFHTDPGARRWGRDKLVRHPFLTPCGKFDPDVFLPEDAGVSALGRIAEAARGWNEHSVNDAIKLLEVFENADLHLQLRISAAEQLGHIMHGGRFHAALVDRGIYALVTSVLAEQTELLPEYAATSEVRSSAASMVCACVLILRLLVEHDCALRHQVLFGTENYVLQACFKCVVSSPAGDTQLKIEVAAFICRGVFDTALVRAVAAKIVGPEGQLPGHLPSRDPVLADKDHIKIDATDGSGDAAQDVRLPQRIAAAMLLPVPVMFGACTTEAHLRAVRTEPGPGPRGLYVPARLLPMVHQMWYTECAGDDRLVYDAEYPHMVPTDDSLRLLDVLDHTPRLEEALQGMKLAASHEGVKEALTTLEVYCIGNDLELRRFVELDWSVPFCRFLAVLPSSSQDAELLSRVIKFCCTVVASGYAADLGWLTEIATSKLLKLLDPEFLGESPENRLLQINTLRLLGLLLTTPKSISLDDSALAQYFAAVLPRLKVIHSASGVVYDIHRVTLFLRLVVLLTGPSGSSARCSADELRELATELVAIINTYTEQGSFVGNTLCWLGITCARQLSAAMIQRDCAWGPHWEWEGSVDWLVPLCADGRAVVRAQALGMLSDYLRSSATTDTLTNAEYEVRQGRVPLMDAMLATLFDQVDECYGVRTAAVDVLVAMLLRDQQCIGALEKGGFFANVSFLVDDAAVSPELLEALCLLLENLLVAEPDTTLIELTRGDTWVKLADLFIVGVSAHPLVRDWTVYTQLLSTLSMAVRRDQGQQVALSLLQTKAFLPAVIKSLDSCHMAIDPAIEEFQWSIYEMTTTMIRCRETAAAVWCCVTENWSSILANCGSDIHKREECFRFFLELFQTGDHKPCRGHAASLDRPVDVVEPKLEFGWLNSETESHLTDATYESKGRSATMGERLCRCLLFRKELQATELLASLLAISHSAKKLAVESGLLVTLVKDLTEIHADLCIDGLDFAAAPPKKLGSSAKFLFALLTVVANFLHQSPFVRGLAIKSGLIQALEPLWGVCVLHDRTAAVLLGVLCNYVAQSPTAARSLAMPTSNKRLLTKSVAILGCKLLRSGTRRALRGPTFAFLSTVVSSNECRAILLKEGFIDEVVIRLRTKRAHAHVIRFLASASYFKDVQNVLLRTASNLDLIVDDVQVHPDAIHVLRNLCFARNSIVIKHTKCLAVLIEMSQSDSPREAHRATLASEGLKALLSRCSKSERQLLEKRLGIHLVATVLGSNSHALLVA